MDTLSIYISGTSRQTQQGPRSQPPASREGGGMQGGSAETSFTGGGSHSACPQGRGGFPAEVPRLGHRPPWQQRDPYHHWRPAGGGLIDKQQVLAGGAGRGAGRSTPWSWRTLIAEPARQGGRRGLSPAPPTADLAGGLAARGVAGRSRRHAAEQGPGPGGWGRHRVCGNAGARGRTQRRGQRSGRWHIYGQKRRLPPPRATHRAAHGSGRVPRGRSARGRMAGRRLRDVTGTLCEPAGGRRPATPRGRRPAAP